MAVYKYRRNCELSRCKKVFYTNRKDQRFCCDDHRIEWHQTQKKTASDILSRIQRLEYEVEKLKSRSFEIGPAKDLKFTVPDPIKKSGKGGQRGKKGKENQARKEEGSKELSSTKAQG